MAGGVLYVGPYRRSLARFERMSVRTSELSFTETGVRMTSDLGQQEFRWQLIDRVWTYPRVWLLFVGGTYMTLPPGNLDQETRPSCWTTSSSTAAGSTKPAFLPTMPSSRSAPSASFPRSARAPAWS